MSVMPTSSVMPPCSAPSALLPDLLRAAATDPAALARLVDLEQERMGRWLVHVLRDDELAADALQETWLILSRGQWRFVVHSSDGDGDVRAWLRQIALRSALRLRERAATHQRILGLWRAREPAPRPVTTPLEQLEESDRGVVVWAAVADLPSTQREALELRFRDGLDFAAIGRVQGCSALTARVRTWRGLSEVRRRLGVLGLLALPGVVRAALGVGGWSAVPAVSAAPLSGFSAGFTSLDARLLAGAGAVTAGAVTLGLMLFTGTGVEVNREGAVVVGEPDVQPIRTTTNAGHPAWEWIPPPATDREGNEPSAVSETTPEAIAPGQVLYDIVVFDAADLHRPTDRWTILGAEQRSQLMSRLGEEEGAQVLSAPKALSRSGEKAEIQVAEQRAFIGGYQRVSDGVEPVISTANEGIRVTVSGRVQDDLVQLTRATVRSDKILGITEYQDALIDGAGQPQVLQWQEVISLQSVSASLPAEGVWLARGSSLLIPGQAGAIVRSTPAGVVPQAGTGESRWWVLITPQVIAEEAAPAPSPAADGEPVPPALPSATG